MRTGIAFPAAIAIGLLSTAAAAQARMPSAPLQQGLITASLPPPGAASTRPDVFRAGPETFAPRSGRRPVRDRRFVPCCGPVFGPVLAPGNRRRTHRSLVPQVSRAQEVGYLRLVVDPVSARVDVDNAYLGSANDLRGGIPLEPGTHRVVLRATGYRAVTFDVSITVDEITTYRTDFSSTLPAERATPVRAGIPRTFYVIPGCYAGDRPPTRIELPAGCDPAALQTLPPATVGGRATMPR